MISACGTCASLWGSIRRRYLFFFQISSPISHHRFLALVLPTSVPLWTAFGTFEIIFTDGTPLQLLFLQQKLGKLHEEEGNRTRPLSQRSRDGTSEYCLAFQSILVVIHYRNNGGEVAVENFQIALALCEGTQLILSPL